MFSLALKLRDAKMVSGFNGIGKIHSRSVQTTGQWASGNDPVAEMSRRLPRLYRD